eukprot:6186326-Pleurochrysis_carterae.AAC.1
MSAGHLPRWRSSTSFWQALAAARYASRQGVRCSVAAPARRHFAARRYALAAVFKAYNIPSVSRYSYDAVIVDGRYF